MTLSHLQFESPWQDRRMDEPRTALLAMLLGSGVSLLLWSLLVRLLWALAA